jgi:hypothetical protein
MKKRSHLSLVVIAAASMLLQACATPQKQPVASAPSDKSGQPANTANLDPLVAEAAKGYTQMEKDGQVLFCKRQRQTGSNMATTTCITEAQLRQQVEDTRKFGDDVRQQGRRCVGASCQNGG